MRRILSVMVMAALFTAACGKSEEQKQAEKAAEDIKKAAEAIGQAAASAGAGETAKAMQSMATALGGKTADGKPVEPIAFQTLQTALPDVADWKMDKPEGERMTMPMPFSKSEARYRNGQQRVDVSIIDTALAAMIMGPYRMMAASGYSRETSDGYEKATTVAGHPAVEKWNTERKRGDLNVIVADRFVVEINGRTVNDVKTLHDFAGKIDFGKIAAMK